MTFALKSRTLTALLLAALVPLFAADAGTIVPLVRGETRTFDLTAGLYFSPGPGKFVDLNDRARDFLALGAGVQGPGGIDASLVDLSIIPAHVTVPSATPGEYQARGFSVRARVKVRVLPDAEPGAKAVMLMLPEVETISRAIGAKAVWSEGMRLVTFVVYRNVAEMRTEVQKAKRDARIAAGKEHRTGNIVFGVIGCLLALFLLFGPASMAIAERSDFDGAVLLPYAIGCFFGVLFGLGGVSKLHAIVTTYEREQTLYQSASISAVAIAALVYFAVTALAWYLIADTWAWRAASAKNAVAGFQAYLVRHRFLGRHLGEAEARIRTILESVRDRLRGGPGGEKDILLLLVEHILEQKLYRQSFPVRIVYSSQYVPLTFEERRQQPPWKIHRAEGAFTAEKNRLREAEITRIVTNAFDAVFPEGVLTFVQTKGEKNYAELHTKYDVHTSDALYFWTQQESLQEERRDYFEGVSIIWHCAFRIADGGQYDFTLTSNPASMLNVLLSTYDGVQSDAPGAVYNEMAASAFRDFGKALIHHFLPHQWRSA